LLTDKSVRAQKKDTTRHQDYNIPYSKHITAIPVNESEVFFYNFLGELKYILDIEKLIAIRNEKIVKYNTKWQMVEDYIT
jgi:hypothetical protein